VDLVTDAEYTHPDLMASARRVLDRQASVERNSPDDLHYQVLDRRSWTDDEPDTFTVDVVHLKCEDKVVLAFSGCATFLSPDIVESEVIPWLTEAVELGKSHGV
jgi:hypothetical protein